MLRARTNYKKTRMFHRDSKARLFCIVAAVLFALPAVAQTEGALGAGLKKCGAIADDAARLSCFDALVLVTGSAPAAPARSATPADPAPAAKATGETPPAMPAVEPVPAVEPAPTVEPAVAAVPEEEPAVEPISDEIGKSSIKVEEQPEPKKYSAKVTRCEENPQSGQYYFFFENGQVWKQAKYRRLRWSECSFDVEVSKGTFGYDMYIPEKDRKIRITRIR